MPKSLLLTVLILLLIPTVLYAQRRTTRPQEEETVVLPTDPKLKELHREFVVKAEKLGDEYLRKKDWEKAHAVFTEVLKLVPNYKSAVEKLKGIEAELSIANRKVVSVSAREGWQDTGINVEEGSPLGFQTDGEWMFAYIGDANGIEIPREIRDYRLGSLIGIISQTPVPDKDLRPFTIGTKARINAPSTGRLLLKMHDFNNEDNRGEIRVEVTGNF